MTTYTKGKWLSQQDRAGARALAVALYQEGRSIRSIAAMLGRSYGLTHALLVEAGVTLRSRSGEDQKVAR